MPYCLAPSADHCGKSSHQISQQDRWVKRAINTAPFTRSLCNCKARRWVGGGRCTGSRDLVTITLQCFELLILSQIKVISLIPETSWSDCRGISVVLLINQASAASRKFGEEWPAAWRTVQNSAASDKLLWKHMFLTCTSDMFGLRCLSCGFTAWKSHAVFMRAKKKEEEEDEEKKRVESFIYAKNDFSQQYLRVIIYDLWKRKLSGVFG